MHHNTNYHQVPWQQTITLIYNHYRKEDDFNWLVDSLFINNKFVDRLIVTQIQNSTFHYVQTFAFMRF